MPTLYQAIEVNHCFKGTALSFEGKKISYSTFIDNVDIFASKLYAYGVRKNQVVTLVSPNVPETIYTFYALNKIGAIVLVVHPLIPPMVLKEAMESVESKLVIFPDIKYLDYKNSLKDKDYLLLNIKSDLNLLKSALYPLIYKSKLKNINKDKYIYRLPLSRESFEINKDDYKPSVYLRSGGTTGNSKTVVLNDKAFNNIAFQCHKILGFSQKEVEGKKMMAVLPIFHGFGLAMGVHSPLVNRATSALMISFSAKKVVKKIKKNELSFLLLIPYMARKLLERKGFKGTKLKNLTHAFIGGDKADLKLFSEFNERMEKANSKCRLLEGYGMTETASVNFVNKLDSYKIGTVGKPIEGVKARIVDDEGKVLECGFEGNIEISTNTMMLEYLNDSELTKEVIEIENNDSWLKTGDIGKIDKDGYLIFIRRKKEMFKIAGINVFPSDINRIALIFEDVKDCATVFVSNDKHPYVALFLESETKNKVELAQLVKKELCSELIKYSVPEKIIVLDKLPRTNVGKVDKNALLNLYN